jgi:hypothetical protein
MLLVKKAILLLLVSLAQSFVSNQMAQWIFLEKQAVNMLGLSLMIKYILLFSQPAF